MADSAVHIPTVLGEHLPFRVWPTGSTFVPFIYSQKWLRRSVAGLLAFALTMPPLPAFADLVLLGGWEADSHNNGYAFIATRYNHAFTPKIALSTQVAGSFLYYNFPNDGGTTKVESPGVTFLLGPKFSTERISVTLMTGAESRTIRRETTTATGRTVENEFKVGPVVNGTLWTNFVPELSVLGIANYDAVNKYTWARATATHGITDPKRPIQLSLGPEGTLQGNFDLFPIQGGGVFQLYHQPSRVSLGFRLGYKRSNFDGAASRNDVYWGISFYKQF